MPETPAWTPLSFALTLPEIVGREPILAQIGQALPPHGLSVFYLCGEGGIGKTRLLQEVLKRAKAEGVVVFTEPVDLYHYPTHSVDGLARAIRAVVPDPFRGTYFWEYDDRLRLYREAQRRGDHEQAQIRLREARQAFEHGVQALVRQQALVVAFDTLEVLGRADPEGAVLTWLVSLLQQAGGDVTLLLAGRPDPQAEDRLKALVGEKLQIIPVGALSPEAVAGYLQQMAEILRQQGQARVAQRLSNLDEAMQTKIALLTDGRPILVALTAELLLSSGRLAPIFQEPLDRLQALTGETLAQKQQAARDAIIEHLWQLRSPLRETLELLSLTRKGMLAELLADLQSISLDEARDRLEQLTALSFIKTRPFDDERRVYLHDELYDLLEAAYPNPVSRARCLENIAAWYEKKRRSLIDQLRVAYTQEAQATQETQGPSVEVLIQQLQNFQIEQVHYLLRSHCSEGLARFVDYSIDAYTLWNLNLDLYLQGEVRDYLGRYPDNVCAQALAWELALAQVRQALRAEQRDEARQILEALQDRPGLERIHEAHRDIWQGSLDMAEAKYSQAEKLFHQAQPHLSGSAISEGNRFKARLQALLYSYWGYLLRLQNRNREAYLIYRQAIPLLRWLDDRHGLADLLKNQAFCQAESGKVLEAQRLIEDALNLIRYEGETYLAGLTWNTQSLIAIRAGKPEEALEPAKKAWEIFRRLPNARGEGLACLALAQAYRRLALAHAETPRRQRTEIEEARAWAEQAVEIFTQRYQEPIRLIEAWIEAGCTCRDRILIERDSFNVPVEWLRNAPDLAEPARRYFQQAIEAEKVTAYHSVDARVNLALLALYLEDFVESERWLQAAEAMVPDRYKLQPGAAYPPARGEEGFWLALGKLYQVRAQSLWRQKSPLLPKIVEYTTLSMAYNDLFAPESYGAQRGQNDLYEVLKKLSVPLLQTVYREAWRTAVKYNLPHSGDDLEKRTLFLRFLESHFGPSEQYLATDELENLTGTGSPPGA